LSSPAPSNITVENTLARLLGPTSAQSQNPHVQISVKRARIAPGTLGGVDRSYPSGLLSDM